MSNFNNIEELQQYQSFRAFYDANLRDNAADISAHGANCGYYGITYNYDIDLLIQTFETEVFDIVADFIEDLGESVAAALAQYCKKNGLSGTPMEYKAYIVWSAAEILSHNVVDDDES